jgi:dihydrofolate synthase / folylpolyglutamate synthase
LDSTNIIQPELSVITNISFDHVGFLGDTLEKIAVEKAGIIKSNTPVVIGEALPETRAVFEIKAKQENATIYFAEEDVKVTFKAYDDGKMMVETSDNRLFKVGLNGIYQLKNVATTLTAVRLLQSLDFNISDNHLSQGLENVVEITGLQGRWQELKDRPRIIADTGHNAAGIQYVVDQLKAQTYSRLRIVFGMVNDKDISTVLNLLPTDADYYFTQANIIRALPSDELMEKAKNYHLNGNAFPSVEKAIESAIYDSSIDDLIFIGGSNFVVGEALEFLGNNK